MDSFRALVEPTHARLISLENGEDRSPATLKLLDRLGVEDGVHDLLLIMTRGRVAWIEVKLAATLHHPRTDLGPAQREYHAAIEALGHQSFVVRSHPEFWTVIDRFHIPHAPVPERAEQLLLPRPRRRPVRRNAVSRASEAAPAP